MFHQSHVFHAIISAAGGGDGRHGRGGYLQDGPRTALDSGLLWANKERDHHSQGREIGHKITLAFKKFING